MHVGLLGCASKSAPEIRVFDRIGQLHNQRFWEPIREEDWEDLCSCTRLDPKSVIKGPQATICSETRDFFCISPKGGMPRSLCSLRVSFWYKEPTFFLTYVLVILLIPVTLNPSLRTPTPQFVLKHVIFFASAPRGACHEACVLCASYSGWRNPLFFLPMCWFYYLFL